MSNGADVRVAIHSRVTQPLLDITLLFLGLPLVLSRENRNMYLAIGMCVGVVIAFMWGVLLLGLDLSQTSIPALALTILILERIIETVRGLSSPSRRIVSRTSLPAGPRGGPARLDGLGQD